MVDRLRHLDLLLQLQGELFEDSLKEAVRKFHFANHCAGYWFVVLLLLGKKVYL